MTLFWRAAARSARPVRAVTEILRTSDRTPTGPPQRTGPDPTSRGCTGRRIPFSIHGRRHKAGKKAHDQKSFHASSSCDSRHAQNS